MFQTKVNAETAPFDGRGRAIEGAHLGAWVEKLESEGS